VGRANGWRRPLLTTSALVALGAAVCMPMNMIFVDSMFTDPQGDDQFRDYHETMATWRLTSGFLFGMTMALFLGVRLANDQRPTGSGRAVPRAATVARASLGGGILAAVNVGAAWLLGGPKRVVISGWDSDQIVIDVFRDGIWLVVLGWAASFPVLAVVGAGLGMLTRPAGATREPYEAREVRRAGPAAHTVVVAVFTVVPAAVTGAVVYRQEGDATRAVLNGLILLIALVLIFYRPFGRR
jgi:hypothetical protein